MRALLLSIALCLSPGCAASATDGAELYGASCGSCHGADGAGNTPVGRAMKIPPIGGTAPDAVRRYVVDVPSHKALADKLSAEQLGAIAEFVAGLHTE